MAGGDLEAFRAAGRTLFSLGLVKGSEGNLSIFDGERLWISRTGCELVHLSESDVLEGSLDAPPAGSSSDLAIHVRMYRERGSGAIAHAHPLGTVPEGWTEGEPHGWYAHAATLTEAVRAIVSDARTGT